MDEFICLDDVCKNESDLVLYRSVASENKINFYFPFEIAKTIGEKTTIEKHYLKLKSIRQPYFTDEIYSPPTGIFFGADVEKKFFTNLLEISNKNSKYFMTKNLEERWFETKPCREKLMFLHSNSDHLTKEYILNLVDYSESSYDKSKQQSFNLEKELMEKSKLLASDSIEMTKKRITFNENDFDCHKLCEECEKDAVFKEISWEPNTEKFKIHAKKLYIKLENIIKKDPTNNKDHPILKPKDCGKNFDKNNAMLEAGIRLYIEHIKEPMPLTAARLKDLFTNALRQNKYPNLKGYFEAKETMKNKVNTVNKHELLPTFLSGTRPLKFFKEYFKEIQSEAHSRNKIL